MSSSEWLPVGELGEIFLGLPLYRLRGSPGQDVPLVNVRDIDRARDPGWGLATATVPDRSRLERYRLKPNDVLVTARGTSFRSALVSDRWTGAVPSSNLITVRLGTKLRPELLHAFLQSHEGRQAVERRLAGSALLTLTAKGLSEVQVPVPPIEEQAELAELMTLAQLQFQEATAAAELQYHLAHRIVLDRLRGKKSMSETRDHD